MSDYRLRIEAEYEAIENSVKGLTNGCPPAPKRLSCLVI